MLYVKQRVYLIRHGDCVKDGTIAVDPTAVMETWKEEMTRPRGVYHAAKGGQRRQGK